MPYDDSEMEGLTNGVAVAVLLERAHSIQWRVLYTLALFFAASPLVLLLHITSGSFMRQMRFVCSARESPPTARASTLISSMLYTQWSRVGL